MKKQRVSVGRIFITQIYHTKPQSRKEEEKEIVFFPSFGPPRLCVNPFFVAPAQAGAYPAYRPSAALSGETR
ncbi:MAG: hypothetical protein HEQ34_13990 [Sphingorhabdus sp.]|uniref:hypothetical protein n=1 Tax=Sphingorhabdus sp. TaxID=1902408 RepID=UPI0025DFEF8F|nr:hypothetical protein [Sphingorhabdus sp.]MCO4093040.1 hypothetical protein [Sphingorhabdus sp.]